MSASSSVPNNIEPTGNKTVTFGFYILAILLNFCLAAQVLTVGLAQFGDPTWWNTHVLLVRGYSILPLIMVALVYIFPFPKRVRVLTTIMPVLLLLLFGTAHVPLPSLLPVAILHPLLGFAIFSMSSTIIHRVGHLVKEQKEA